MARGKRSLVKRIPAKLDTVLLDIQKKNNMKFTEAGDMAADIIMGARKKGKIVERIKRELEF